ncbi:tyrosine-protein kinase JAK1-like, partial [Argonauta hians]
GPLPHNCEKPDCICILSYDDKQKFCIKTENDKDISVEDICIECAKQLGIFSTNVYLFGLVKKDGKTWLNPAKKLKAGIDNSNKYIFRLHYYSESILEQVELFHYLHKQFHNDIIINRYEFTEETMSKIRGIGIVDVVIDCKEKNRNSGSINLPENFIEYFPLKIFDNINCLTKLHLIHRLKTKAIQEFQKDTSTEVHRKNYIREVLKLFKEDLCKETYKCCNLNNTVDVTIEKKQNSHEMVFTLTDITYSIASLRWIDMKPNNCVQLNFRQCSPQVLCFDDSETAESFVTSIDGHFRLAYKFYCSLCDKVEPPSVKHLRQHGFHADIPEKDIIKILRTKPDCYLILWNLMEPSQYKIASLNPNFKNEDNSRREILYEKILDYSLPNIEVLENIRSSNFKQMIRPDKFATSSLLLCKPQNYNSDQETKGTETQHDILSQSDIIFSASQDLIGQGMFTNVYIAEYNGNKHNRLAVKQLKDFSDSPYSLQLFLNSIKEHQILSKCPSFLQMEGIILSPKCSLVMEYASFKSVSQYFCQNADIHVDLILTLAATVSDGLEYLKKHDLVHGNLHGHNLMLVTMKEVKIADTGMARFADFYSQTDPINIKRKAWLAPELQIHKRNPTCESDMFAFGSCLCEMLCWECKPPHDNYHDQNKYEHACRLYNSKPDGLNDTTKSSEQFESVYKEVHSLILACRALSSEQRPKPADVSRKLLQLAGKLENVPCAMEFTQDHSRTLCNHNYEQNHEMKPPTITDEIKKNITIYLQPKTTTQNVVSPLEIHIEDIVIEKTLGKGAFGKVSKITYKKNGETRIGAFKEIFEKKYSAMISLESSILQNLDHKRIVKFYGFCLNPSGIILEFIGGGDLSSYLKQKQCTLPQQINTILIETAEGMEYLQSKKIIHLDVAARNILLTTDKHVKITDFGLAKRMNSDTIYKVKSNRTIPLFWSSPEVVNHEIPLKADVWSYGILMWECYSGGAIPKLPDLEFKKCIYKSAWEKGTRLPIPKHCSENCYKIMKKCWEYKPNDRPDFSSIINSLKSL